MKPSDIFGIIVRTLGVLVLLGSIWYFLFGLAEAAGFVSEEHGGDKALYIVTGLAGMVMALVLMRCASWFVRFAYPLDERKREGRSPKGMPL